MECHWVQRQGKRDVSQLIEAVQLIILSLWSVSSGHQRDEIHFPLITLNQVATHPAAARAGQIFPHELWPKVVTNC